MMASVQQIKVLLDERKWRVMRSSKTALVEEGQIQRRIRGISKDDVDACLSYLDDYGSVKNAGKQQYVDDPMVGGKIRKGRYRVVDAGTVETDEQRGIFDIYQTLRLGLADKLVWDEARLGNDKLLAGSTEAVTGLADTTSDSPERYVNVIFPNISPDKVQAVAEAISATYTDPKIRGQIYVGTFHKVFVTTEVSAEDGVGRVTLFMGLPQFTVNSFDNWGGSKQTESAYLFNVPKSQVQTIIDGWKTLAGTSAGATVGYRDGLADIRLTKRSGGIEKTGIVTGWDCRYKTTEDYYLGVDTATADALALTQPPAGQRWELTKREDGQGRWDVVISKRVVQYRNITGLVVEQSDESSVTQQQQLGLTSETPADMTEATGVVKSQRVEIKDDCSKDITTNVETGKEQIITIKSEDAASSVTEERKTYQTSALSDPTEEAGKLKRVVNRDSKYPGKKETESTTETVKDQTGSEYVESPSRSIERATHTQGTALTKPSRETGKIKRRRNVPTRAGKVETLDETETPIDQSSTSASEDAYRTTAITRHTEGSTIADKAAASGTVRNVEESPTEAGNLRTEDRVETGTNVADAKKTVSVDTFQTVTRTTDVCDAAADTQPPTPSDGQTATVEVEKSKYKGKFDNTSEVAAANAVSDAEKSVEVDTFVTKTEATDVGQASAATTPPVPEAGEVKRATVRKSKFKNRYDNTVVVEAHNAVANAEQEKVITPFETIVRSKDVAQAAAATLPSSQTAGTIVTKRTRKARAKDRHDHDTETRTATEQLNFQRTKRMEGDQTTTVDESKNIATEPTLPTTFSAGSIVTLRKRLNDFLLWDKEETTETAVKQDSGWVQVKEGANVGYIRIFKNCTSAELDDIRADHTASYSVTVYPSINRFGKYDGRAVKEPITGVVDDSTWEGYGEESLLNGTNPLVDPRNRRYFVRILRTNSYAKALRYRMGTSTVGDGVTYGSVTAGYSVTGAYGGYRTGVEHLGMGRWIATRVELNKTDYGLT